jgi:thiol peroxidase
MPTTVTLRGTPLALYGSPLKPGDYAPEASLITSKLEELIVGGARGKPQILITVPSLDTPVCATEAKKFNEALAAMKDKIVAALISMDLPFAQSRYCESYQVEGLPIASDYRFRDMARYGVVVAEGPLRGILARAVFVVNPAGQITYTELVPEIGQEPNYDAALSALQALL